ncbi:GNAT family N-acetyltransferase [Bacillus sp. AGMB 02131]|uniref:GNAT family N-acetyltransferase n=1 Tax=Peribacillus faecalis TaxID=2772559 RepID=A0A927CWS3_9BACI|nr:GNAT family N-acetyltransferase [Peribacillus faecalis]MBD3108589.1 GNAT family N-acetyltransferase [Peribacillus faecalis]
MKFRKANEHDIPEILAIIQQAQSYFKEQRIDQWQGDYPNAETIREDISKEYGYVLLKENCVAATVAVSFDDEETYDKIFEGEWLSNQPYAVIHRLAINNELKGSGLSTIVMEHIFDLCRQKGIHSIKVDTHEENIPMCKLLEKNLFSYCGIIHVSDGERVAFERLI